MSRTEAKSTDRELAYGVPDGVLGLLGPVERPAPGTLPLRGDLAHVALAGIHLAAHYVIPEVREAGAAGANLRLAPEDDADIVRKLAEGTRLEMLDVAGDWVWACLGPEGPTGYCRARELATRER
jgi:hypothetical protein